MNDPKISLCCDCQYCGDKHSFPMPNDKLEVDPCNHLLKAYYCCAKKCSFYGKRIDTKYMTRCKYFKAL